MSAPIDAPATRDRTVWTPLGWRVLVVVLATVVVALDLTAWVRTPLVIAAAVVTAVFAVERIDRRGRAEAWATVVGAGVAVVVLLGFALGVLPWGLTTTSWGVAVGLLEVAALVAFAVLRPLPVRPMIARRVSPAAIGWGAAVTAVLAGALVWSVASFDATNVEPLAIAADARPGPSGGVTVTVSAGEQQGPFRLDLVTAAGRTTVTRDLRVGPGDDASVTVDVPEGTRALLQLVPMGAGTPVRELILDPGTAIEEAP